MKMSVEELNAMPLMTIYPTMRCNLNCDYCILKKFRLHASDPDTVNFLQLPLFRNTLQNCAPTHLILSGGEPMLADGLSTFIKDFGRIGHRFSLLTNLSFPIPRIKDFFDSFPCEYISYLLISHHFQSGIRIEDVIKRCLLLRQLEISHFINYVLLPGEFDRVSGFVAKLREHGINWIIKPLYGEWSGRQGRFPTAYTLDEDIEILSMCTTRREAIELFDGVYATGSLCRGGREHCVWSYWRYGIDGLVSPCCHGDGNPMRLEDTSFISGNPERSPCKLEYCAGALFSKFVSGMDEDCSGLPELIAGTAEPLGIERVMSFVREVQAKGLRLVNEEKFRRIKIAISASI